MTQNEPDDGLEYYYVTYSCLGLLACAGIVRQKKIEGRELGDFNIAGALQYLSKLLGGPVIVQNWHLITKKRAYEINQFAENVMKDLGVEGSSDNVRHLRIVPEAKKNETENAETPVPPIEPGPYGNRNK